MNKIIILIIICLFSNIDKIVGQTYNFEITNSTNRTIQVYSLYYDKDSVRNSGSYIFCKNINNNQCSLSAPINPYIDHVRLDLIAIDDSTKDTIYVQSLNKEQLNVEILKINILANNIEKLPADFNTLPFIQIQSKSFRKILKITDPIDIKLQNRKTVQGTIKSFNKETITVTDLDKNDITITRKELVGIKSCGPVFAIGAISFFHHCNYTSLDYPTFKKVHQKLIKTPNGTIRFEWKE